MTPSERARLVRLCLRLTGDPDAAEDLAHEALFEALRSTRRPADPARQAAWLAGVARNVCLRWRRSRRGDLRHRLRPPPDQHDPGSAAEAVPDPIDLERCIEREELAGLLDRALLLLPSATRAALILRYVEERPQSRIALRLGPPRGPP